MAIWKSVVGKLWMTIIGLVALVLFILGLFLLGFIDIYFHNSNDVKKLFIYTGIIGFLLTTFFAFFLSTKITQPLLQLKKAADLITLGEFWTRVPIRSTDEIGELAKTFNHMAERLEKTIKDLNQEKEHLASVLSSMTDAVVTFDVEGYLILANPLGEKLIETWNEIVWEDEEHHYRSGQLLPVPLQSLFETVVQETKQLNSKIHVHNDVWSVRMAPLYANDVVRGAVVVMRDVTKDHRSDKLRSDFLANISHELRTPLSMLQGYSEALLDDIAGSAEERNELAQVILDESLRMTRLVEHLLDLTRMEEGYFELNFAEVDMGALALRVYRKFTVRSREQDITLNYIAGEEPLILSMGDEDRLEQVLTNLLDNALRHSAAGSLISIRTFLMGPNSNRAIRIEIEDEGQGIPAEDLPFLFERFYKANKARTRGSFEGTGLGLAIVKNIVEAHQGRIEVMSTWGQGTTFTVTIPCDEHKV